MLICAIRKGYKLLLYVGYDCIKNIILYSNSFAEF